MLKDKLIGTALGDTNHPITIDKSRCLRMRFNRNECPLCTANCHAEAITIHDDIVIDTDKCTLCMVCVSECPADCFDIHGGDFLGVLTRLRKLGSSVPCAVLGCKAAPDTNAHEKTACLGLLSDEHLIALNTLMDRPVQLNLTLCAQCKNAFVIDTLKERIAGIRETTGITVSEKAVLIENKAELRFSPASYDRRGFFSAIRNMTLHGAAGLIENAEGDAVHSYSEKRLPLKKNLLNMTVKTITDKNISARFLKEYAFTVEAAASCDNCFSCIGLCPTGALTSSRDESGTGLLFNSSRCIGCGLCRDFCPNNSITLLQGCAGAKYFNHEICNEDSRRANSTGPGICEDAVEAVCYYE